MRNRHRKIPGNLSPFWQQVCMHIRQVAAERFALSVEQFHILRRGLDSNKG